MTGRGIHPAALQGRTRIMSILSDLADEVLNYPHEYLSIEVVEVTPATGTKINKDEEVRFRFQVTNSGPLDVENAEFLIDGLEHCEVKDGNSAHAPWVDSHTTQKGYFPRIPAHQSGNPVVSNGSPYTFRPKQALDTRTELVRVSVAGWDTDLDHILAHHSRADEAAHGGYVAKVFPK